MKNILLIIAISVFATGCANTTIYHWGDYSDTLYTYTKEPSDVSKSAHKTQLIEIIKTAQSKNKKIPPGINFELALLCAADGEKDNAVKYFNEERLLFPESEKYVALALENMEIK